MLERADAMRERICGLARLASQPGERGRLNGFLMLQLAVLEDLFARRRAECARRACPSCDRTTLFAALLGKLSSEAHQLSRGRLGTIKIGEGSRARLSPSCHYMTAKRRNLATISDSETRLAQRFEPTLELNLTA